MTFGRRVVLLCVYLGMGCGIEPVTSATYSDPDGRIAFIGQGSGGGFAIFIMRPSGGGIRPLLDEDGGFDYTGMTWAPNLQRMAVSSNRGESAGFDIYTVNIDGTGLRVLVDNPANDFAPSWSPNGKKIAFQSYRNDTTEWDIYVISTDGSGEVNLTETAGDEEVPSWSPDGSKIIYQVTENGGSNIYIMDWNGANPRPLTTTGFGVANEGAVWSPDGRRIAFASNRHQDLSLAIPGAMAQYDIYTMAPDGSDVRRLTAYSDSVHALRWPTWSPDGQRLAAEMFDDSPETVRGRWGIVVMNADGGDLKELNMTQQGRVPRWSPN